jgi:formylglycine-generating enzyme required for sulfatase activity
VRRFLVLVLVLVPASAAAGCPRSVPAPPANGRPDAVAPVSDAESAPSSDAAVESEAPPVDAGPPPPPEGMLLVPGGTFTMGTNDAGEGDERPAHPVTLSAFYLDQTEVTQSAYEACVAEAKCRKAHVEDLPAAFRGPKRPIVNVSWNDARSYCEWKGKRLPREAELERAVRGDDGRKFPWGNDAPTPARAVYSTGAPEDVGTHGAGRGPYGHDDLTGNVWEWMEDDYDPIAYTRATASEGKPGTCAEIRAAQDKLRAEKREGFTGSNPIPTDCEKSIRGGAYNYPAYGLRSTNRVHHPGSFRLKMTGFRCAKDAT